MCFKEKEKKILVGFLPCVRYEYRCFTTNSLLNPRKYSSYYNPPYLKNRGSRSQRDEHTQGPMAKSWQTNISTQLRCCYSFHLPESPLKFVLMMSPKSILCIAGFLKLINALDIPRWTCKMRNIISLPVAFSVNVGPYPCSDLTNSVDNSEKVETLVH